SVEDSLSGLAQCEAFSRISVRSPQRVVGLHKAEDTIKRKLGVIRKLVKPFLDQRFGTRILCLPRKRPRQRARGLGPNGDILQPTRELISLLQYRQGLSDLVLIVVLSPNRDQHLHMVGRIAPVSLPFDNALSAFQQLIDG